MKTKILRNLFVILAVGWAAVLLPLDAGAGPTSKAVQLAGRIGRGRGGVERADSEHNFRAPRNVVGATTAAAREAALASYPHFRLVDLGTLGGPNAYTVFPAVMLNNRGENIAQASTDILDPYPFTFADDLIWHGIYKAPNGMVSDLGALTSVAQSLPVWISGNGFIVGTSENGLLDDTADFPQLRPVRWDLAHNLVDLGTFGGNTGWLPQSITKDRSPATPRTRFQKTQTWHRS